MDFSRTYALLGPDSKAKLSSARVAVFGIGGVGGHLAEALVRSGIGHIDLIDGDIVSESNINRQIVALKSTIGRPKVEVMKKRLLDINPDCKVTTRYDFYTLDNKDTFDLSNYDYIADAIDSVSAKIDIIVRAKTLNVNIISAMGAGNKLDPTKFKVADIAKTSVCPLARVMRKELRARGVNHLKVVYTEEQDKGANLAEGNARRAVPGSVSFVPSVMGLIMAGEIVKDIVK